MTFRIEEVRYEKIDREGHYVWHWRFKGVHGKGIYGSIVTGSQGRGLYLLAEGDWPGLDADWKRRLTCLAVSEGFGVSPDASVEYATEALATFLIQIGWGPRVFN